MASFEHNLAAYNAVEAALSGDGIQPNDMAAVRSIAVLEDVSGGPADVTQDNMILRLNAIEVGAGGAGGHLNTLDALNSIVVLRGGVGGHQNDLDAINEWIDQVAAIANWFLDETSGIVAVDQVDSPAQDGTYTSVTVGVIDGIFGGINQKAGRLDGVNDFIDVDNVAAAFNALGSEFTVLGWFKQGDPTPPATEWLFYFRTTAGNDYVRIANITSDGRFHGQFTTGGVVETTLLISEFSDLGWLPFAIMVDEANNIMKLRIRGTDSNIDTSFNTFGANITSLNIGQTSGAGHWFGSVAHFEIRLPLTDAQIDAIHDRTKNFTQTFFTLDVRRPSGIAARLALHILTNEGAERDTSIVATGAARLIAANTDFIFVDDDPDFTPVAGSVLTIYAWVRFTTAAVQVVMGKGTADDATGLEWKLSIDGSSNLIFSVGQGASVVTATIAAAINTLFFVKCQYDVDGDEISIELDDDGSPVTAVPGGTPNDTASIMAFGRLGGLAGSDFDGFIGPTYFINGAAPSAANDADAFNGGVPRVFSGLSSGLQALIVAAYDWPITTAS